MIRNYKEIQDKLKQSNRIRTPMKRQRALLEGLNVLFLIGFILVVLTGCGSINPGKWKGIETTSKDEQYYLVKDVFLSPGSSANAKESVEIDKTTKPNA